MSYIIIIFQIEDRKWHKISKLCSLYIINIKTQKQKHKKFKNLKKMPKMPNHQINKTMICSLSLSLRVSRPSYFGFVSIFFFFGYSYFSPFFLGMMIRKHINKIATKLHGGILYIVKLPWQLYCTFQHYRQQFFSF